MNRHAGLPNWIVIVLGVFLLAPTTPSPLFAQEHNHDRHTLLLLHCNGNLFGARGEKPAQAQGVAFEKGIFGNGAYFAPGNQVYFPSAGNINSTEGTLEFWIKPRWNGNDGEGYVVLRFGVGGGMYFAKDGANNWRSIFNRFGVGSPEVGVAFNVSAWQAGQWHHAAFTWKSDLLKLYVDGLLLNEYQVPVPLNFVNESTFQLGADFSSYYLDAVIDELGISDIARSTEEIQDSFLAGLRISSLTLQPNPIELLVTQETTPTLIAVTNLGTLSIPPAWARWKSSKPSVASVDENGRITGNSSGRAKITASLEGESASAIVIVGTSSLPASDLGAIPDDDSPHAQPMDGASFALNTGAEMKLQGAETPATYALAQNYPNPFNPETEIRFQLPQASHVVMKIFNILGEEIRTLVDEQREAGYHGVRWDGRDKNGNPVASGVYLYQLQAGSFSEMKKMSLLR